ncbi:MAG: hypothetical protein K6F00_06795 [Lachnospiraceae bacterium]|nr:hypothetical protein [Lachnospiraceae bacterium]
MDEINDIQQKEKQININIEPQNMEDLFLPKEIEGSKFSYDLPDNLNAYIEKQKNDPNKQYSESLLKDIFAEENQKYIKGGQYQKDLLAIKKDDAGGIGVKRLDYKDRKKLEYKIASVKYSGTIADSKTFVKIITLGFGGDNKGMKEIKRRLNIVQRFISGDMSLFKKNDREYDVDQFKNVVTEVFESAIDACKNYTATHRESPLTVWGKRRLSEVSGILDQLQLDYNKYRDAAEDLAAGAYDDREELKSPEDLVEKTDFVEIEDVEHQHEGNSTEVYKGKVKEVNENGEIVTKTYYIKENLPLLHKDMDGFLNRRLKELEVSQKLKNKDPETLKSYGNRTEKEELRMQKSHADDIDYQNGMELLNIIKSRIEKSSVNERNLIRRKYAMFFKHDFDKVFAELLEYNNAIKLLKQNGMKTLGEWEKEAKAKDADPKAVVIYNLLSKQKVKNAKEAKEKSASEWVIEKLNIKDDMIIQLLQKMDKQADNNKMRVDGKKASRIETMFRITMGKEVELYGQIMEKNKLEDNEMSQYNTMATSYLGDKYGFNNEVVSTKIKKGAFPRWTGDKTQNSITMQEVAEGVEWIDLIKKGKPISLSPKAVRQLTRLQMFDTLCQQIDRHGRNFKCQYEEDKYGRITVKSIKAYDHDQSFSTGNLATAFEEKRDKNGKLTEAKNNRFLPSLMKVVKKDSPMYRYIAGKYFNTSVYDTRWMKMQKEEPIMDYGKDGFNGRYDSDVKELELTNIQKDLVLTGFYGGQTQMEGEGEKAYKEPIVLGASSLSAINDKDKKYSRFYGANIHKYSVLRKRGTPRTEREEDGKPVNEEGKYYEKVYESTDENGYEEYSNIQYNANAKKVMDEVISIIDTLGEFFVEKKMTEAKSKVKYNAYYEQYGGMLNVKTFFRPAEELMKDKAGLENAAKAIRRLKILNNEYDFSDMIISLKNMGATLNYEGYKVGAKDFFHSFDGRRNYGGVLQAYIDQTLFMFAKSFANVPEVQKIMDETEEVPEDMKSMINENGDLVIPNMLHMDEDAYRSIQEMVRDFGEDGKGELYWQLKKKHLTDPAIESIFIRAKEMLSRIDNEVKPAAEKFLKMLYKEGDVRRNFFLSEKDYESCDSLYDMALDPGDTYLVQDNKHFIACNEEFSSYMSEKEKENVLEERNAVVTHPKRWNAKRENKLKTNIRSEIEG